MGACRWTIFSIHYYCHTTGYYAFALKSRVVRVASDPSVRFLVCTSFLFTTVRMCRLFTCLSGVGQEKSSERAIIINNNQRELNLILWISSTEDWVVRFGRWARSVRVLPLRVILCTIGCCMQPTLPWRLVVQRTHAFRETRGWRAWEIQRSYVVRVHVRACKNENDWKLKCVSIDLISRLRAPRTWS